MMTVAIASGSFAVLTLFWSCVCTASSSIGSNLRASELLILISILTGNLKKNLPFREKSFHLLI